MPEMLPGCPRAVRVAGRYLRPERLPVLLVVPFGELDESAFVGLLQLETA